MADAFIYETQNNRVQRAIALSLAILLAGAGLITSFWNVQLSDNREGEGMLSRFTPDIVHNLNPVKQFVISTMSGMIIFPIPNEFAFYVGIKQGNPYLLSILAAVAGFALGNAVSYFLGLRLSKHVLYLVSAKQLYSLRRRVNKYGVYAIFFLNVIPAPSDVLTFGLGITRYNTKRLFFFLILANAIKFSLIAAAIYYFNGTVF